MSSASYKIQNPSLRKCLKRATQLWRKDSPVVKSTDCNSEDLDSVHYFNRGFSMTMSKSHRGRFLKVFG